MYIFKSNHRDGPMGHKNDKDIDTKRYFKSYCLLHFIDNR